MNLIACARSKPNVSFAITFLSLILSACGGDKADAKTNTQSSATKNETVAFTFDEFVANLGPIPPLYNDENLVNGTGTDVQDGPPILIRRKAPCPGAREFVVQDAIIQSGLKDNIPQFHRMITFHKNESEVTEFFAELTNSEVGCKLTRFPKKEFTVSRVDTSQFEGLEAVTIQDDSVDKENATSYINYYVRSGKTSVISVSVKESVNLDAAPLLSDFLSTLSLFSFE